MLRLIYFLVSIALPALLAAQYCDNLCGFGTQCSWDVLAKSYACLCSTGYLNHRWDRLTNTHVCRECESSACGRGTACAWKSTIRVCKCRPGYDHLHRDPSTQRLVCNDVNECGPGLVTQCGDGALCENTEGSYNCTCKFGYSSITIANDKYTCPDVDECRTPEGHHCGNGTQCVNSPGGYLCNCLKGYRNKVYSTGKYECADTDECTLSPCETNSDCINIPGSHECRCFQGFARTIDGISCTDIDECLDYDRCNSSSNCVNTIGSYHCEALVKTPNHSNEVTTANMLDSTSIPTNDDDNEKGPVATKANIGYTNLINDDNKQVYVGLSIGVLLAVLLSTGVVAIVLLCRRRRRSRRKAVKKAIFHLAAMSSRYSIVTEHSLDVSFAFDNSMVIPTFTLDERLRRDRSADIVTDFNRSQQQSSDMPSTENSSSRSSTKSAKNRPVLPIQEVASPVETSLNEITGLNNPLYSAEIGDNIDSTYSGNNHYINEPIIANDNSLAELNSHYGGANQQNNSDIQGIYPDSINFSTEPCNSQGRNLLSTKNLEPDQSEIPDISDEILKMGGSLESNSKDPDALPGYDDLPQTGSNCDSGGKLAGGLNPSINSDLANNDNLDNMRRSDDNPSRGILGLHSGISYVKDGVGNAGGDPRKSQLTVCASSSNEYAKIDEAPYEEIDDGTSAQSVLSRSELRGEQTLLDEILELTNSLSRFPHAQAHEYNLLRGEPKPIYDDENQ